MNVEAAFKDCKYLYAQRFLRSFDRFTVERSMYGHWVTGYWRGIAVDVWTRFGETPDGKRHYLRSIGTVRVPGLQFDWFRSGGDFTTDFRKLMQAFWWVRVQEAYMAAGYTFEPTALNRPLPFTSIVYCRRDSLSLSLERPAVYQPQPFVVRDSVVTVNVRSLYNDHMPLHLSVLYPDVPDTLPALYSPEFTERLNAAVAGVTRDLQTGVNNILASLTGRRDFKFGSVSVAEEEPAGPRLLSNG